ncbi:MAG: polysaccharide biosynthesis C-terminal domain-containing protein [Flavobacteriaceae bacterium]
MLIKNSIIVLFLKVFGIVMQFAAIFILTNNASEEIFGEYSFLNSILLVIGAFCLLGMNNSFLQFSGKLQAENNIGLLKILYKRNVIILTLVFLFIIGLYFVLAYTLEIKYFKDETIRGIYNLIVLILFPYSLTLLNFQVLRGINKLFLSELTSNIFRFGGLLILVIFLYYLDRFEFLLYGYLILFWLLSTITTLIILFHFLKLKIRINKNLKDLEFKKIISTSFPMSFSLISLLLMQSIDVFIIERYLDFEYIAYYSSAIKITTGIGLILTTINSVIAPDLSKLFFLKDYIGLKKLIQDSTMLNFYLTAPIVLTIYIFSEFLLSLFGSNYIEANSALKVMVVGQMLNAFCGSVGYYLNMTGREKVFLKIILLALLINLVLNLVLIPLYGINGAAWATSISLVFWNVFGVIYIYKKDRIGVFIFSNKFLKT